MRVLWYWIVCCLHAVVAFFLSCDMCTFLSLLLFIVIFSFIVRLGLYGWAGLVGLLWLRLLGWACVIGLLQLGWCAWVGVDGLV